jgi:hypothetical protein
MVTRSHFGLSLPPFHGNLRSLNFSVSGHAVAEMLRRDIPRAMVDAVLLSPGTDCG